MYNKSFLVDTNIMKGVLFVINSFCIKNNQNFILDYLLNQLQQTDLDGIYLSLTEELTDRHLQGGGLGAVQEGGRDQILVPHTDAAADAAGGSNGTKQWQEHLGIGAEQRAAIDHGGFFQITGQGFHKAGVQERCKGQVPAGLNQQTGPQIIIQANLVHHDNQGNQAADEGNDHQSNQIAVDNLEPGSLDTGYHEAGQRTECNHECNGTQGDETGVLHGLEILHLPIGFREVLQGEHILGKAQGIENDIFTELECTDHKVVNGDQNDDGRNDHQNLTDPGDDFIFFVQHQS